MTGELIGNEIQPEGGIEEVLLPPIRAGLKRSLRERKTRLKDINYHLGRFALWLVLPLANQKSTPDGPLGQISRRFSNLRPAVFFAIQIRKLDQSLSSI